MAARAIWKGVIRFGGDGGKGGKDGGPSVPVKLYSAITDRNVHFRLLHEADKTPVSQEMVDPESGEAVPGDEIRKGAVTDEGIVMLDEEELESLEPEPSRDIEILRFVPAGQIDHRWYLRPYWLGPDESRKSDDAEAGYLALIRALEEREVEGIARWTMRKKRYQGALRVREGYPVLITLRHAEEVVSAADLEPPGGRDFNKKEVQLAGRLIESLADSFDPEAWQDEYRARLLQMIEDKAEGKTIKMPRKPRKEAEGSLAEQLEASLKRGKVA